MSLLWMDYETEFDNLVDTANQYEKEANPEYFAGLTNRVKKIIYRDTRYNVDFLYTAYVLKEKKIMEDYAVWLYQLMASVLKNRTHIQTVEYVVRHLEYIRQAVEKTVSEDKISELQQLLACAQNSIRAQIAGEEEAEKTGIDYTAPVSEYESEIGEYMEALFSKDMRKALQLVQKFSERGIPAATIYVDILAESMRRVGELWHTAKISVDAEHYCTSVTQMAMAQMYPVLFSEERKNRTILCACPGTELHEIGARMVADLFENDGWNGIFLGAAVPQDAMLEAIRADKPDLVALSVTMPQHLLTCAELVKAIREEFPDIKIAVGGGAFRSTHELWEKWPVDIYTEDARELLNRANAEIAG